MNEEKKPGSEETMRIEHDSLGDIMVPADALYGAQTQRAVENFPFSGLRFPREMVEAIAAVKGGAAESNAELGQLDSEHALFIRRAADEVRAGMYDEEFPVDIYMTGSGTSFNMNANEVIANLANRLAKEEGKTTDIHPNDHVNMGQSSNDVIPTVIHIASLTQLRRELLPALESLESTIRSKADEFQGIVKTGRTHLMDALPIYISDELLGWSVQVRQTITRIKELIPYISRVALGGTAVGTGLNAHPNFAAGVLEKAAALLDIELEENANHFAAQSSMDEMVRLSGELKAFASALMKIANDLRWMNSGPNAGLHELSLIALQPGSSIMPGKVNPVICESAMQISAQVIGNDVAVTIGNERGNFQLNVMLPLIGYNVLQSIRLLANVTRQLAVTTIKPMEVNKEVLQEHLAKNPIIITALAPEIGYDKASAIAKKAFRERRPVLDVAEEETEIDREMLMQKMDAAILAQGNKKRDI